MADAISQFSQIKNEFSYLAPRGWCRFGDAVCGGAFLPWYWFLIKRLRFIKKTPPNGVVDSIIFEKEKNGITSANCEEPTCGRLLACIAPAGAYQAGNTGAKHRLNVTARWAVTRDSSRSRNLCFIESRRDHQTVRHIGIYQYLLP